MRANNYVVMVGLGLLTLFFITSNTSALSRNELLFYTNFENGTETKFSRGSGDALPGYKASFVDGVSGKAAVVSADQGLIKTLEKPIPFWMDISILYHYTDENIGALRYSQKDNMDYNEGTISFWHKALDWQSGGKDHYLVHFNMEDTLSFFWATYCSWAEFRQANISNRDNYKKFERYFGFEKDRWYNIVLSWREKGKEIQEYIDGVLCGRLGEGVPGYPKQGTFFALGEAGKWHSAFDNVMVLARAVTDVEAAVLYQQGLEQKERSTISIPEISQKPIMDGKFGSSEWRDATQLSGWIDGILGVANNDKTVVYTAYDNENLYLCFRWPIPQEFLLSRTQYVGTPLKRDTAKSAFDKRTILEDDHFSLSITTERGNLSFVINGNGAVYDAKNGDTSWDSNWRYGIEENDEFWTVELEVPFTSISDRLPIREFGINFGHRAFQIEEMDSVWAFDGKTVTSQAQGRLTNAMPVIRVERFDDPSGGKLSLQGEILSQQAEKLELSFGVIPIFPTSEKEIILKKTIEVSAGSPSKFIFDKQLETEMAGTNYLRIENKTGQILFYQQLPFAYSIYHGIEVKYVPSPDTVLVDIKLGSYHWIEEPLNGTLKIISLSQEKKEVMQLDVKSFDSVKKTVEFSANKLPIGKYEVQLSLTKAGKKLPLVSDTFEKKTLPEWYNNKIGEEDTVPAPWTPIEISKNEVKVWGRSYQFDKSLFPSQIYSQGKKILSEPISLKVCRNGEWESLTPSEIIIKKPKNERATIDSKAVTGNLQINNEAWLEFDGFSWYEITFQPKKEETIIEGLTLEIPFSREVAELWYAGEYRPDSPTGYLPQEHYNSQPTNFVRVGNPEIGLQWCWQSLKGWNIENPQQAMEFIPEKGKYTVRFHIIDHETEITGPFTFSFGLQSLPVRPINPPGFRRIHPSQGERQTTPLKGFDSIVPYTRGWSGRLNDTNLSDEDLKHHAEVLGEKWKKDRIIWSHYLNLQFIDGRVPEYKYFCEEWRPAPSARPDLKREVTELPGTEANYIQAPICLGSKSFVEFYLYYLDRFLREYTKESTPIGLYFDCADVITCGNSFHGCGYTDSAGNRQSEQAVLTWRETMKKIYRVAKKYGQKNWITFHMSGQPFMAYLSFADVLIPGEQFNAYFTMKKAQEKDWPYNYTRMLSLPRMRAEFTPYAWGGAHLFLSELWSFAADQPPEVHRPALAHLFGICFVHDTMTWGGIDWPQIPVLDALNTYFPWNDDVVFHPYWNNQELISLEKFDRDKVVASLFTNGKDNELGDKRKSYLMVFAFNDTNEEVSTGIKLNLGKLHLEEYKDGILWDPLSDKKFNLKEGESTITIPARNFRMLFLINYE